MAVVVLGVTGCIAAYKACEVLRELQRRGHEVRVVMTDAATHFVAPLTFEALSHHPVVVDQWRLGERSDMPHISLADAAELLLVAPATANTLGKFAAGIADDALTTLYLATRAPVVMAPAMNVNMYEHVAVRESIARLKARGVGIVEPGEGYLACGWTGKGRLAEPDAVVQAALAALRRRSDLAGVSVVVTAGPTVEDLDPVRFISNRSSGRMGYRIAEAARDRGARVVLVSGPTALPDPAGVETLRVRSASEMARAVEGAAKDAAIVVMAAAVADYRPVAVASQKLKKDGERLTVELERTADVLQMLGSAKGSRFLVGFAAETEALRDNALDKLRRKHLDLVVANEVGRAGQGFDSDENAALLLDAAGGEVEVPLTSKRELADRIWDRVAELRRPTGRQSERG